MSTNPVTITAPEGVPFIEIERVVDAPVEAAYRAHSDPELVRQWLGPHGYDMKIERWDLRTGGGYRYVHVNEKGDEFTFNGVFHVARPHEFVVQTFEFEGFPDVVSIETLRFTDLGDGRTRLHGHSTYPSQEARDGMIASGMAKGVIQGYERLDTVLADL
ncbi:MAG TPA: SRPBCC family protein [Dermatophilaceae bacterium]|nr:SRPBCC family protein [Dermatophilaceae bacterium]